MKDALMPEVEKTEIAFERRVQFAPSFDRRDPDPSKNYGIDAVRIFFYLIGPKGAVQWAIGTTWYVPSAQEHIKTAPAETQHTLENMLGGSRYQPQAWDLGYHSREPLYDYQREQGPSQASCDALDGAPCYYDGSTLNAERLIQPFLAGGDEAVWAELETYYRSVFEEAAE